MKSLLLTTALSALMLSGCIVISNKKPTNTNPYTKLADNEFVIPDNATKVLTRGQLSCDARTICPELSVDWKKQTNNNYRIRIDFFETQKFDIQQVVFTVDGEEFTHNLSTKTTYRSVQNSSTIDSANYVNVTSDFLFKLKNARNIHVSIQNDQGKVSHYMLEDGVQSNAYKVFIKRIAS